jgi:hypothetical protein
MLRDYWYDITAWNVYALTKDTKDSCYKELKYVFEKFPKYHMNILLGNWNAKMGEEDSFNPTIGNGSLHKISNDNGFKIANFATSKSIIVRDAVFPHHNIHKLRLLGCFLMGRPTIRLITFL